MEYTFISELNTSCDGAREYSLASECEV